ncbi:MAG: two-component sensor histidine kinase [Nitrosopumilales archaeon CG_4_9_14_0_2_um_filter_34_16]|nr:MAG: two-component sensor histidine kinase [Nitrosopumilales archaeon CG_4_9_14_0_2_um_filter_34_16]
MKTNPAYVLKILALSIIGISLLYATQFILDEDQFRSISIGIYAIIPAILAIISSYVAVKEWKNKTRNKFAMMFFAGGIICWFIAEQAWTVTEVIFDQDPFPSIADVFYLLAYPFFVGFFILFLKPIKTDISRNIILFSVAISLVFVIPSLYVLMDYYQEDTSLAFGIGILYPIFSSVLLFFILLGITYFFKGNQTNFWIMIFIGFLIDSIADTLFLFTIIDDSYYDGHITDLLYLIGYLFYIGGLVFYLKTKADSFNSETRIMTFEVIGKFVIPFVIGTTFLITSLLLVYSYGENISNESLVTSLFAGIFIIITVFSIIVFLISKNITKFLQLKTKEIQNQKQDLEIMLGKKSDMTFQSSEFSNIGANLSQIIHDLKNPISVISINLDLLENSGIDNSILSSRVKSMRESLNLINEQMNDVLNYVKKPTIKIIEAKLLEILEKAISNIDVPNTVSIHRPDTDVTIRCDPVRMTLVFINLLTNAISAVNKKGIIHIKVKQENNKTIIDFEDSGEGIPQDIMDKIFEPLFTTKSTGTGLGLPTCQKIILQHNGRISVKNNPTTFTIELPQK